MKYAAAIILVTLPFAAAAQDDDKGYLTTLLEDNLGGDDRVVNIVGFAGALSSEATITSLTVADSEGVWLTLEDVVLQWNRGALLRGAIDVETLGAARIIVTRAPRAENAPPAAEATPFALPELPVSIQLGTLQVDRIELGPDFLGEPLAFEVSGSASLAGGEGTADITATRLEGPTGRFAIAGAYTNATEALNLNLDLTEGAGGLVAGIIGLPGAPSIDLQLSGDGILSDFAATLSLDTDSQRRLAGDITLQEAEGRSTFALDIGGNIAPLFAPDYQEFFGPDVRLVTMGRQTAEGGYALQSLDLTARKLRLTGAADISASGWPDRLALSGAIADDGGEVVLLPLSGPQTFVDRVNLNIGYDRSVSDDWTAEFAIAGLDRPGVFVREITLDGGGVIAEGSGDVTALLNYAASGVELDDGGAAEALGDEMRGIFDLTYQRGQPTRLNRLTLTGPGLELLGEATIETPENNLATQATLNLSAENLSRFAALAGQPGLAGAADLAILSNINPLDADYDVLIAGGTRDLAVGIAQLDPLLAGEGALSLQARRDTTGTVLDGLRIETEEAIVTADAQISSDGGAAQFDVSVADIGLIEPSLSGPGQIAGTATLGDDSQTDFNITASLPGTNLTADGTAMLANAGTTINALVNAEVDDLARYADLTGQPVSGGMAITLDGRLQPDMLGAATFDARTRDLQTGFAQLDPLLAGAGTLSVDIARTGSDSFRISDLDLRTPALSLDATGAGSLSGTAQAAIAATLNDAGDLAAGLSGPVEIKLDADRNAAEAISVDLSVIGSDTNIQLDAVATPVADAFSIEGTLDADVAELAPFAPLAGRTIAGSVSVDANGTLVSDLSAFAADLTLGSRNLQIGDARIDPVLAGTGAIQGTVGRVQDGDIAADLSGQLGVTTVDLKAVAKPDGDAFAVTGAVKASVSDLRPFRALAGQPISGAIAADITGSATTDASAFDLDVKVTTESPAIGNPQVDQLLRGSGDLSVRATRTEGGIDVPNFAASFAQVTASGSGQARDDGTGTAQFQARLADVGLFTDQLSGPVAASGNASRTAGTWGLNIDANGPGGINATGAGSVFDNGNLNVTVRGGAPLGLANTILAPRRIDGDLTFDVAINGPPALSSVSGRLSTAGAQLSAPTLAVSLQEITGGVTLNGTNAQVGIAGNVSTGGGLTIDGPVGLAAPFNGDLGIVLNGIVLQDPNLYRTTVDGRISVTGPLTGGARIAGTLNLGQTDVQVPSSGIGAFGDLPDVTHIGEGRATRTTLDRAGVGIADETSSGTAGPAFPIDLTINAPSRIFIRGRGLDAELGGALIIGGTTANVVPTGQFNLVRGRLNILQQRFDLTEGTATLQGDFIPSLRLVAETETRTGTLVRIIVAGPATSPDVTFESVPDLPQDEVLAQLIFGRNLADISPLQAVQLASAVGTLAGRGGGGIIDNFRQGVGLDDFDVTTDADGNAAVRAGKYLSDNVYTDVTINAEGETEINLNLDITSDITAKGSVDADGETSIGIFFERDY